MKLLKFNNITLLLFLMLSSCSDDETIPDIEVAFEANITIIAIDDGVGFNDLSTGDPTEWRWIIEGPETITSSEQNPNITFDLPGTYSVTLEARNENKNGTLTKENFIEVIDPLSIGLIAHYPFNGNANDESGNMLNGVVEGATLSLDRKGNSNAAYIFDGNDYIDLQTALLPTNGDDWSISTWVNSDNVNSANQAVIFGQYSSGTDPVGSERFHLFELSGSWQYFYGNASISELFQINTLQEDWQHITLVCKNNLIATYFNGQLVGTDIAIGTIPNVNSLIGFDGWTVKNRYYSGKIDDVRIYDRGLTTEEVLELFQK